MQNIEILKKAIKKAGKSESFNKYDLAYLMQDGYGIPYYYTLIFSHDFAKALWGEELKEGDKYIYSVAMYDIKHWQYHLQQMVLESNPLEYLKKFIDGGEDEEIEELPPGYMQSTTGEIIQTPKPDDRNL